MYSRNLFGLDFVRNFLSIVPKFFEAYAVRTLIKFGYSWRKISRKGKCRKIPRVHYKIKESFSYGNDISLVWFQI